MSPKIVDKEKRRKEIALIALTVFAEKGFEGAAINGIAKRAGVGKGTIYEYFKSKDDLILSSIRVWAELMSQEAEKRLKGIEDPVERLRIFAQSSVTGFIRDKNMAKLLFAISEIMLDEEKAYPHREMFQAMFEGTYKIIAAVLKDGAIKGVFKPEVLEDAEKITVNLVAYLDGIRVHYYMNKHYMDLKEQIEFFIERLLESIMLPQSTKKGGEYDSE